MSRRPSLSKTPQGVSGILTPDKEDFDRDLDASDLRIVLADGTQIQPTAVHRFTKIGDAVNKAFAKEGFVLDHEFHIVLPEALELVEDYTLRFVNGALDDIAFTPFDDVSQAIHVAGAYDIDNPEKHAKLSSYMGPTGGGVSYDDGTPFRILDDETGQIVKTGQVTLAQEANNVTGADVYDIDFSDVTAPGAYRIEVAGVGVSHRFEIRDGVFEDALDLSLEGLFNHRAFIELDGSHSDFVRPGNDQLKLYQSSVSNTDTAFLGVGDRLKVFEPNADRSSFTPITEARGGWFDAGDYVTNQNHFDVIDNLVRTFNTSPSFFETFDPDIPESGGPIPDILDEAIWGISLYTSLQNEDGGVSGGYEFDSHPQGTRSWEEEEAFIYAPDFYTSYQFAKSAAALSGAVRPYDAALAADLEERTIKAFAWAEQDAADNAQRIQNGSRSIGDKTDSVRQSSAVELYKLTGDTSYHDVYLEGDRQHHNSEAHVVYAQLDASMYEVDAGEQAGRTVGSSTPPIRSWASPRPTVSTPSTTQRTSRTGVTTPSRRRAQISSGWRLAMR